MRRDLGVIKFLLCIILMTSMFSNNLHSATSLSFSDVNSSDWFYEDVSTLVDKGVINGYTDGSFRPARTVSVAEFIKMTLAATNQILVTPSGNYWYSKYVETAIAQGYISSTYYSDYKRAITRGEMGDIIDKILNLNYENKSSYIDNIADYTLVADYHKDSSVDVYIAGIMTGYNDGTIKSNNPANRCEAAVVIVRMIDSARRNPPVVAVVSDSNSEEPKAMQEAEAQTSTAPMMVHSLEIQPISKSLSVDGIQIGMSEDYVLQFLGQPDERLPNQYGYEWFVYAGDYTKFKLLGMKENKVVSFYTNVHIDSTLGLKVGSTDQEANIALTLSEYQDYYYSIYDGMNIRLYSQKGLNDGIEGYLVYDSTTINISNPTRETLDSMEKVLFHITNGERVSHGLNPLLWSEEARLSSYEHSLDMGVNEYFAHTSLSGEGSKERMQETGIVANYYAENIAAGYVNPFQFHYAFIHSEGHKKNILTDRITHFGIGIYYDPSSTYTYYITQNFYEER